MSSHTLFRAVLVAGAIAFALPTSASAQSAYATEMSYGREAFDGSNYGLAQRHFEGAYSAAGSDGQKATALYSLAVTLQRQGRLEEAKERASTALELSPKHSQAKALIEELSDAASKGASKAAAAKAAPGAKAGPASGQPVDLSKIEQEELAAIKRAREAGVDLAGEPLRKGPQTAKQGEAFKQTTAHRDAAKESKERPEATPAKASAPPRERETKEARAPAARGKDTAAAAETAAKAEAPAPKSKDSTAAKSEPAPAPIVATIAKKKPPAPAAVAPVPAAAAVAVDYSSIGSLEPSGARLLISGPGIAAPLLAAGFTAGDRSIALVTGPAKAADGTENAIELRQIDILTGKVGDIYALHTEAAASLAAVPASASSFVTAVPTSKKGKAVSLHTWDPATVANVDAIEMDGSGKDLALALDAIVTSRNGSRMAAVHSTGVQIFNTRGLRGAGSYRFAVRADLAAPVAAAMSGNGARVVVSNGARLRLTDKSSVKEIGANDATAPIDIVALSENGDVIVAASAMQLRLIDANSGKELEALPAAANPITALAFAPDSKRLAIALQDRVQVWTLTGHKLELELDAAGSPSRLAFSGDGRLLLASGPSGTRVWLVDPLSPAHPTSAAPAPMASVPAVPTEAAKVAAAPDAAKAETAAAATAAAAVPATPVKTPEPQAAPAEAPVNVASAATAPVPTEPAAAAPAAGTGASEPASSVAAAGPARSENTPAAVSTVAPAQDTAPAMPKPDARRLTQLKAQRSKALGASDCDRVKALDEQIESDAQHGACLAKVEQAGRARLLAQLATDRIVALNAGDCGRVKALDVEIGSGNVHGACLQRAEQAKLAAERNQLISDRQAAFDRMDCHAVKELDIKVGQDGLFETCSVERLVKTGTARELYLAAAKSDADKKLMEARKYYRAIVDRHPQDDLAIKAAERMTVLSDLETQERNAAMATGTTGGSRERARPRQKRR